MSNLEAYMVTFHCWNYLQILIVISIYSHCCQSCIVSLFLLYQMVDIHQKIIPWQFEQIWSTTAFTVGKITSEGDPPHNHC